MQKTLVTFVTLAFVLGITTSGLAAENPLDLLNQLSRQEQSDSTAVGGQVLGAPAQESVPSDQEVETEIAGDMTADEDTVESKLPGYLSKLESAVQADSKDFTSLVKMAVAYKLQKRHDRAVEALLKATEVEPAARDLYPRLAQAFSETDPGIKVVVNGKKVVFDSQPVNRNGRVLVPIRAVIEKLGGVVGWDPATAKVTVTLGATVIEVVKESTVAKVNGKAVALDVPATNIGGRILVPIRFVNENLNKAVDYFPGSTGTAVISINDK